MRCGAIDEEEKAQGRAPHKSKDLSCPLIQAKRTVKCPTRPLKQLDIKALKYQIDRFKDTTRKANSISGEKVSISESGCVLEWLLCRSSSRF